ncbi:MAG: TrmH family RNA methyltransferase [Schleiferiaceae bacterium]|nr:TrmH family RNA methyltransferase [Schleiferiaceae bacterium]MDG1881007.1 TrmH family RNA methyltransferase [Schleiferiaceae bacterium]
MKKKTTNELNRLSSNSYSNSLKTPVWIILENLRSAHNIGSFFRTADAFGLAGISICGYSARPPHKQLDKVALGATESVEWLGFDNTIDAIMESKKNGYTVFGVEQIHQAYSLENMPCPKNGIALVFGNEVNGIEEETLALCDGAIEVPQFGIKHSLNVSVCGGSVLWEATRKYRFNSK